MPKLPLVSVLIAAYNHEKYVDEAINSIINQTYNNIELIVVDDGSKDNTWLKLCNLKEKCEQRFSYVNFQTQENQGACNTLNKLLSLASGEYIYIIASDDMAKPQAIEREVTFLSQNLDYILAVGDNEFIDANSVCIGWNSRKKTTPLEKAVYKTFGKFLQYKNPDIDFNSERFGLYETFVNRNYIPNGYLYRTSAIKKIGGFTKEAPLEDWYLHLQLSKMGKYKYFDEILFSYRWHDNNTVKREEYMRYVSLKTRDYEKRIVSQKGNEQWLDIFEKMSVSIKMKFKLGNAIKYYRSYDFITRKYILEIFGKKIIITSKAVK